MKFQLVLSVVLCAATVLAETAAKPAPVKKVKDGTSFRMRISGGMVRKEGSARGKVLFLNTQKRVAQDSLLRALKEIENRLHPQMEIKSGDPVDLAGVGAAVRAAGAQLGVVILDAPTGVPALLTAPEEGWAVVNVAKLDVDGVSPEVLASRTRKEVLRAFGLIAGAAFMGLDSNLLRADIRIPKDLDLVKDEMYGIDVCRGMWNNMPRMGVEPWKVATYKVACQEGWAPQPTNEYQKAIWDKVHQLPTNPIPLTKPTK